MHDGADDTGNDILDFLTARGLMAAGDRPAMAALTGGVSSDIWQVDLAGGPVCVKRALAKLKVEQDWFAPVERNAFEVAWMRIANDIHAGNAPEVLAHDPVRGLFAMAYLAPDRHPLWKDRLRRGDADAVFAAEVGRRLGAIHRATAAQPALAGRFATDETFHAIRLEPYLLATARAHPDLAPVLDSLAETTAETREALVHGDVSPKNILVGPDGPVFLDAECAWWGDPAFDLAFCLNHLLLKCLWTPAAARGFLDCFTALARTYDAEPAVEARTARLLPGLLLARVDGKSPVEYITRDEQRNHVRHCARGLLTAPVDTLAAVADAWRRELGL